MPLLIRYRGMLDHAGESTAFAYIISRDTLYEKGRYLGPVLCRNNGNIGLARPLLGDFRRVLKPDTDRWFIDFWRQFIAK